MTQMDTETKVLESTNTDQAKTIIICQWVFITDVLVYLMKMFLLYINNYVK